MTKRYSYTFYPLSKNRYSGLENNLPQPNNETPPTSNIFLFQDGSIFEFQDDQNFEFN